MGSNSEILVELKTTVDEMIASSVEVKGTAFTNVAAGLFELQQVTHAAASIELLATSRGVDVRSTTKAIYALLVSVSARLCQSIPEDDVKEALALSNQLEAQRMSVVEKWR